MEITFPRRFRGPLTSANGGYACGRLATFVDADEVEVTLRLPPPLDRALEVRRDGDAAVLLDGEAIVAEARPASVDADPPAPVSLAEAEEAVTRHVRVGSGSCSSRRVRHSPANLARASMERHSTRPLAKSSTCASQ